MSEHNWTPGPWHIDEECEGMFNRYCLYVCDIPVSRQNAHLIAAAPDLFEALEAIVNAGEWYTSALEFPREEDGTQLEQQARAALAKAKGEQV